MLPGVFAEPEGSFRCRDVTLRNVATVALRFMSSPISPPPKRQHGHRKLPAAAACPLERLGTPVLQPVTQPWRATSELALGRHLGALARSLLLRRLLGAAGLLDDADEVVGRGRRRGRNTL